MLSYLLAFIRLLKLRNLVLLTQNKILFILYSSTAVVNSSIVSLPSCLIFVIRDVKFLQY